MSGARTIRVSASIWNEISLNRVRRRAQEKHLFNFGFVFSRTYWACSEQMEKKNDITVSSYKTETEAKDGITDDLDETGNIYREEYVWGIVLTADVLEEGKHRKTWIIVNISKIKSSAPLRV